MPNAHQGAAGSTTCAWTPHHHNAIASHSKAHATSTANAHHTTATATYANITAQGGAIRMRNAYQATAIMDTAA